MKKILLSTLMSGFAVCAFAQAPTWDFESWSGTGTGTEPSGWVSENEVTIIPGNTQSVFQATTPQYVHGGTKALKLVSVKMNTSIAGLPNPIGLVAPGQVNGFNAPKFGIQFTSRPAFVNFWYQYTPVTSDTAQFLITLWNSTTHDTLGFGFWKTGATVNVYTSQTVAIMYNPAFSAQFPDSMALTFSSTKLLNLNYTMCTNCGKQGSILYVDDITFSGWNGINEHLSSEGITVFPNPANDFVNIAVDALNEAFAVSAYDVTGRMICTTPLALSNNGINRRVGLIHTSGLSAGLYSYSVVDKKGVPLRAGRFSVVR